MGECMVVGEAGECVAVRVGGKEGATLQWAARAWLNQACFSVSVGFYCRPGAGAQKLHIALCAAGFGNSDR